MDQTREIIVRLLSSLGSRKEVEQYLKQFASVDQRKFAVVKVGGAILRNELEELASSLTFLQRVGLYPIVIHGGGPQLNAALEAAGIETRRIDGMRITEGETLEVARKVFIRENLRLVEMLENLGTRARPLTSGVFEAELMDPESLGYVGEVRDIHLETVSSAIRSHTLPILTSLGETPSGQIVNINADVAARELALAIEPFKIIFLTSTGGLLDEHGSIISSINLTEDYDHLMEQDWVHSGMRLKLREIKELLDELPLSSSVSITSASQLPKELFTHRGSGTLVRRGEKVEEHQSWEGIERGRLRGLLEACFGRSLDDDYFETHTPRQVYVTASYRAVAIVEEHDGVPYLDKFAVTPKAQGEGLGGSIWARLREDHAALFWRSRSSNPINAWYFEQADGTYRDGEWTVFWYGIEEFEEMRDVIRRALELSPSI